ncbi:MAG TPA: hypothetical protein VIF32_04010 [Gemmatimonadaceae bacterium]
MAAVSQLVVVAGLLVTLGCDRRPARAVARETTDAAATSDTVVRRVYIVERRASAMQRPTGELRARRALDRLDSVLVIRVFDQRGREMSGVPVQWTLGYGGAGAELRVINGRTDTLGLSRARFTPGRTADEQSVVATVANVGRIDFRVSIPVASIRVLAVRPAIWSGDDEIIGAELRDEAGNELSGGALSWATTDTAVLRVRSDDPTHARVTGLLAGSASVVGWVGSGTVRGTARLVVKPTIAGRFVTIDASPPPPVRMEIRAGDVRDSLPVENGQFHRRVELPFDIDVDVRAEVQEAASRYHLVRLRVTAQRELQDLRIALVPTTWRIDAGTYAGREMPIDAERAMRRTFSSGAFWRLAPISGPGPRKILGWRESELPLHIAFSRSRSRESISADDSVQFWAIARQFERDLGASVFVPADMRGDSTRSNLVPVEIGSQGTEAHTFVSFGQPGDARDGVLVFHEAATLRNPHVVAHELAHLLGFGHSSWWATISEPVGGREPRLTPQDVAYMQLAMRLRRLQQETGARPGLPVAVQ